jgi:uncharacterized membrane protein
MRPENKVVLGILVISIFVFIVAISSLYVQIQISEGNICGCLIPLPLFIPFIASIGLFIGTLSFYLWYTPKQSKINKEVLLKLFDPKEREIIIKLFENKGKISQSKLVKETSLSKVQVSRVIEKLKEKKIISKESKGKTNLIELDRDFYESFR